MMNLETKTHLSPRQTQEYQLHIESCLESSSIDPPFLASALSPYLSISNDISKFPLTQYPNPEIQVRRSSLGLLLVSMILRNSSADSWNIRAMKSIAS